MQAQCLRCSLYTTAALSSGRPIKIHGRDSGAVRRERTARTNVITVVTLSFPAWAKAFSQAGLKHGGNKCARHREIVSRLRRWLIRSAFNYFHSTNGIFLSGIMLIYGRDTIRRAADFALNSWNSCVRRRDSNIALSSLPL